MKRNLNISFVHINKIRLILASLIYSIFTCIFFDIFTFCWNILTSILIIIFLFCYLFYIPFLYKSYKYTLLENYIRINYGVFIKKQIYVKVSSISNVFIYQLPLEKIFKTKSISLNVKGSHINIFSLTNIRIDELLKHISSTIF